MARYKFTEDFELQIIHTCPKAKSMSQAAQLLCLNCHALTDNYRAKNIKNLSA